MCADQISSEPRDTDNQPSSKDDGRSKRSNSIESSKSILPPLGPTSNKHEANKNSSFVAGNMSRQATEDGVGGGGIGSKTGTRENTKTEIQRLGMGRKAATLYLSRTHTMMKGRSSSQALYKSSTEESNLPNSSSRCGKTSQGLSKQATGVEGTEGVSEEGEELINIAGLRGVEKEFTFTGYDIEEDVEPRETTPADLDDEERTRRKYEEIYLNSCRQLGINPVAPIKNSLTDSHVVLKTRGLGVKGAKAIAIALVGNKRVKSLDLEDNWIGADGAASIATMTLGNDVITEISIAENRIGTKGIRAICEALSNNRTIRKLDVSGSNLFDHDAKYIAILLENNYCLQELRARHNKFGELGGLYLGPAIANNETLQVLDLSWNHLRGKGALAVAVGLGANLGLKVLDVSWNGFDAHACKLLGESLSENNSLRELDISNNRLDTEAIGGLMKGIQVNQTITALRLGNNPFTPDVATVVLRAVIESSCSEIRELDLTNIVIEEEFKILLEEARKNRLLLVTHGPLIKKGESMVREGDAISGFMDPVQALYENMSQKGYRVIDLFKRFDADRSLTVTKDEFYTGLVSAHVQMTVGQLEELMEKLDKNKDGMVDLKELMDGEKLFRRNSIRKKLRRESKEKAVRRRRSGSLPDLNLTGKRKSSVAGLPSVVE